MGHVRSGNLLIINTEEQENDVAFRISSVPMDALIVFFGSGLAKMSAQ